MSLDFSLEVTEPHEVFTANVTHNLGPMAEALGVYDCLWHPNESGFYWADQIVGKVADAVAALRTCPEAYRQFEASNGWGTVEGMLQFLEQVHSALERYPDARLRANT